VQNFWNDPCRTSKPPQTVSEHSAEEKIWTNEGASIRRADKTESRAVHLFFYSQQHEETTPVIHQYEQWMRGLWYVRENWNHKNTMINLKRQDNMNTSKINVFDTREKTKTCKCGCVSSYIKVSKNKVTYKRTDDGNFIITLTYTWHIASRWYR
jgi:hypothetical protein